MDEDVREGSGGVADVRALLERVQDGADQAVDRGEILNVLELALVVPFQVPRVDGGTVGLVVQEEHGEVPDLVPPVAVLLPLRGLHPLDEVFQHRPVFLDDEDHGVAADVGRDVVRLRLLEVARLTARRQRVGGQVPRADNVPDAHLGALLSEHAALLRVPPQEALVQTELGLAAQAVVRSREHDDQLVAGVHGFANQAGVVRRLPRLHLSDDHAAPVPGAAARRVFQVL